MSLHNSPFDTIQPSPTCSDTPRSARSSPEGNIPAERSQYGRQMSGEMVEVSHKSFMVNYAAFNPSDEDVTACIDTLVKAKLVSSERDCFVHCAKKPSSLFSSETEGFLFLTAICQVLSKAKVKGRKASCALEQRPHNTTASEISGSTHKIDGYFKPFETTVPVPVSWSLSSENEEIPTADIVANCEWKVKCSTADVRDNRLKAVSGAVHVMNEDERRTHTYSITIEHEQMSLWYWSRSHSAKSVSFDFTKSISETVRVLASFVFGTMEELGYDPTVQRRLESVSRRMRRTLVFKVQDHYFKKLRHVSEHLGLCITGRATRVYEVIEVWSFDDLTPIPGKKSKILKDVWLEAEAKTEKEIQDSIFGELEKLAAALADEDSPEPDRFAVLPKNDKKLVRDALRDQSYRRYFLTISADEKVAQSKALAPSAVDSPNLFSRILPPTKGGSLPYTDPSRRTAGSIPTKCSPVEYLAQRKQILSRDYAPKYRYRVVSEEVCVALHYVVELNTILHAMKDCLLAVELLFLIGWVHRDISSGNLLWFPTPDGGRGILSDLEYAKKFNPDGKGSADPKTGTPYFMPIEIQSQEYICEAFDEDSNTLMSPDDIFTTPNITEHQIVHNFEHDIESFFWLLVWTITSRMDDQPLRDLVAKIFVQDSAFNGARQSALLKPKLTRSLLNLLPEPMNKFVQPVEWFRRHLFNSYVNRKYNIGDVSTYADLYCVARKALDSCIQIIKQSGVPVPRSVVNSAPVVGKRKRTAADNTQQASKV